MSTGKTYSTKYLLDSNNNRGSEGQILSTTSTGIDWVDANTVPGTGLWVTSGNNIYNSNSGNVGIGTTSPGKKLDVVSTSGTSIVQSLRNPSTSWNQYALTRYGTEGADFRYMDFGYFRGNNNEATRGLVVKSQANATLVTFLDAGNVGIGTTSPGARLQVYSTATRDISIFGHGTQAQNNWQAQHAFFISAGQGVMISKANASNNTNRLHLFYSTSNGDAQYMLHDTNSNDKVKLNTNGDSHFNGGNVGIGTTSPSTKLEVTGHVTINSPAGASQTSYGLRLRKTNSSSAVQAGGEILASVYPPNTNAANLIFKTANASANLTQRMVIDGIGNVGIGTTSPTGYRLVVENTSEDLLKLHNSTDGLDALISFTNPGGTLGRIQGIDNGGLGFDVGNNAGGIISNAMFVKNNGKVGIGNTSPQNLLHLGDNANSKAGTIRIDSFVANQFWKIEPGTNTLNIKDYDGTSLVSFNGASNYALFNGGNVGIGTTSPGKKLHVVESGTNNTAIFENSGQTYSSTAIKVSEAVNNRAILSFAVGDALASTDIQAEIAGVVVNDGGTLKGDLTFKTNVGDNLQERMRIDSSGVIKFNAYDGTNNTGSPTHILGTDASGNVVKSTAGGSIGPWLPLAGGTLTGNTNLTGSTKKLILKSGAQLGFEDAAPTGTIYLYNDGAATSRLNIGGTMWVEEAGNVGIGATSPASKLNVASTGANAYSPTLDSASNMKGIRNVLTSNADDMVGIYFATGSSTTGTHWSGITGSRSDNASHWGTQLNFYTHNNDVANLNHATQKMVIKGNGNIGIGNDDPGAKLDVKGNYGDVIKAVSGSQNITTNFVAPSTGSGLNSIISTGGKLNIGTSDAQIFNLTTNSLSRISILSDGKVGIGTTSPSQKLEVAGSVAVTGTNVTVANASNPYIYINDTNAGAGIFQQEGNTTRIGSDSNTQVVLVQNNATAVTIDTSKNVGIGTTSPDYKLEVNGTLGVNRTDGIIFAGSAAAGYGNKITADTSNDFIFSTSLPSAPYTVSEKMRIANGGATTFTSTVTATNFILSSDERLKENIEKVCDNRVKADWKTFELKTEKGQKRYGVIAQELEKTNPEFVREDSQGFKSVAYIDLLIAKIAELEARLEKLEK